MKRKLDLLVVSSFRNLPLYDMCRDIPRKELEKRMGLKHGILSSYLTLRLSPYYKKGDPTPNAKKIARYFDLPVEVLMPPNLYKLPLPRKVERPFPIPSDKLLPMMEARKQHLLPEVAGDESNPEFRFLQRENAETIEEVLRTLPSRERRVLRLRFGLDNGEEKTLDEIAQRTVSATTGEVGVSRMAVAVIEARALRKLRQPSRSRGLRALLDDKVGFEGLRVDNEEFLIHPNSDSSDAHDRLMELQQRQWEEERIAKQRYRDAENRNLANLIYETVGPKPFWVSEAEEAAPDIPKARVRYLLERMTKRGLVEKFDGYPVRYRLRKK